MRFSALAAALTVALLSSLPARALPGEADAVQKYCGVPGGESRTTSPVTGHMQRNFLYNDLILHFEPEGGGWGFTTAWHGHLPVTRDQLERRLPCFKTAMEQAAAAPAAAHSTDPTTQQQTQPQTPFDNHNFGIPHLHMILALIVVFLLLILIPSAKARKAKKNAAEHADAPTQPEVHRKPDVSHVQTPAHSTSKHPDLDDI